jgi:hypothetical protein
LKGGAIELYTSHWRHPLLEHVDAQIVSIARGQPRWRLPFRYRKLRSLAPCDAAWNAPNRESYEEAYRSQLEELGIGTILADLERVSGGSPVVALCWERLDEPDAWCHRTMLARYLEEHASLKVPELKPGMLPPRPDTPEPRLFWK